MGIEGIQDFEEVGAVNQTITNICRTISVSFVSDISESAKDHSQSEFCRFLTYTKLQPNTAATFFLLPFCTTVWGLLHTSSQSDIDSVRFR